MYSFTCIFPWYTVSSVKGPPSESTFPSKINNNIYSINNVCFLKFITDHWTRLRNNFQVHGRQRDAEYKLKMTDQARATFDRWQHLGKGVLHTGFLLKWKIVRPRGTAKRSVEGLIYLSSAHVPHLLQKNEQACCFLGACTYRQRNLVKSRIERVLTGKSMNIKESGKEGWSKRQRHKSRL